jgi:hypothetical protein
LGEIFDANSKQFLEDFTSNELIARVFFISAEYSGGLAVQADMGFLRLEGWVLRLQGGG